MPSDSPSRAGRSPARRMTSATTTCTISTAGVAMISRAMARPSRSCTPRTPAASSAANAVPSNESPANTESGSSEATTGPMASAIQSMPISHHHSSISAGSTGMITSWRACRASRNQ